MSRSRRPPRPQHVPLRSASWTRAESAEDGQWQVRNLAASASGRVYRCPGCDQEIPASIPHVVTWPAADLGSVEDRRHWHTPCWSARARRRPGGRRN